MEREGCRCRAPRSSSRGLRRRGVVPPEPGEHTHAEDPLGRSLVQADARPRAYSPPLVFCGTWTPDTDVPTTPPG